MAAACPHKDLPEAGSSWLRGARVQRLLLAILRLLKI
jgi:hypothetical protein